MGREQQIRIMPWLISRCRMPPPCFISTVPEPRRLLQVPHSPLVQENGSKVAQGKTNILLKSTQCTVLCLNIPTNHPAQWPKWMTLRWLPAKCQSPVVR